MREAKSRGLSRLLTLALIASRQAPAIIFIDEIDAIGTKRFDSDKSGDREVQRTMLELLNQLDGFSSDSRIKVSSLRGLGGHAERH